jgi:hypothetical protein
VTRPIPHDTQIAGIERSTVGDFWSWAYSDVVSNGIRSVFAEYLIGKALEVVDCARIEWDAVDLRYRDCGIEVKSSGYVQSWPQFGPSRIVFDIRQRLPWDAQTNTLGDSLQRAADCYVFCVHTAKCREECHILDVAQWEFYVLGKLEIEAALGLQKSIALSRLRNLCLDVGCGPIPLDRVRDAVDGALGFDRK